MLSQSACGRYIITGFHLPVVCELDAGISLLLFLPQGLCPSNYRNVGLGLWSPHTQQHSVALSTCLGLPAQRKRERVNHTGQHSKGKRAVESGRQTSILSAEKKTKNRAGYI